MKYSGSSSAFSVLLCGDGAGLQTERQGGGFRGIRLSGRGGPHPSGCPLLATAGSLPGAWSQRPPAGFLEQDDEKGRWHRFRWVHPHGRCSQLLLNTRARFVLSKRKRPRRPWREGRASARRTLHPGAVRQGGNSDAAWERPRHACAVGRRKRKQPDAEDTGGTVPRTRDTSGPGVGGGRGQKGGAGGVGGAVSVSGDGVWENGQNYGRGCWGRRATPGTSLMPRSARLFKRGQDGQLGDARFTTMQKNARRFCYARPQKEEETGHTEFSPENRSETAGASTVPA